MMAYETNIVPAEYRLLPYLTFLAPFADSHVWTCCIPVIDPVASHFVTWRFSNMADAGSENMLEANGEQQLSRIVKGKEILVRVSCFPLFLII